MNDRTVWQRLLQPLSRPQVHPTSAGLYHYMREASGTYTRFHLRIEPDGRGILMANATAAALLSPSGVVIAKGLLDDESEPEIIGKLSTQFRGASREVMNRDLERVAGLLANLSSPTDNYPIINLDDPAVSSHESRLLAPFEADVPLATPDKLLPIIDKLWQVAIPHLIVLVPENPNPEHLVRAVERAEDLGMIAGVRGRATDLSNHGLVEQLANAGLDHLTVPYASADPNVHDSYLGAGDHKSATDLLKMAFEIEVAPVAEVPLLTTTTGGLYETITPLLATGIRNLSFFAIAALDEMPVKQRSDALSSSAMPQTADQVEELANELDVRFIWEPPVLRDPAVTIAQQVRQGPRCSGDVSIRVEPSGEVIPPRGPYRSAGNLLDNEWVDIWNNEAFLRYRERVERPTRCDECPGLAICAADCPRKPAGWSQGVGGQLS